MASEMLGGNWDDDAIYGIPKKKKKEKKSKSKFWEIIADIAGDIVESLLD